MRLTTLDPQAISRQLYICGGLCGPTLYVGLCLPQEALFINHACKNPNACFICVRTEGQDTVYVQAIKEIEGGQFISIDYGQNFKSSPCLCDDCWNSKKKAIAKKK
jgi:hypothetical protein